MNRLILAVALCGLFALGLSQKIAFRDCGSKLAALTEVDVVPCPRFPCPFVRNTNISFTVYFTPNTAAPDATIKMFGVIAGVEVPFSLPDSNACDGFKCPLAPGTPLVYKNTIFIDPHFPAITLVVKVELTSSAGEIACFTLPVNIS